MNGDPNNGPKTRDKWFDTSVFSVVPQANSATATNVAASFTGRTVPHRSFSFQKHQFTERVGAQFRFETFNTFNHTNLDGVTGVVTAMNSASFGKVTLARDPRILQLGMKVSF